MFIIQKGYLFLQGNSVSTTKYNVLTFLPKGLYEQVTTDTIRKNYKLLCHPGDDKNNVTRINALTGYD